MIHVFFSCPVADRRETGAIAFPQEGRYDTGNCRVVVGLARISVRMDGCSLISCEAFGREISRVVIPRELIARRVGELAGEISAAWAGREMTILAAMTGSLVFVADLIRRLPVRLRIELLRVRSYPGRATRSDGVALAEPVPESLAGEHVLIVDDILDTGRTLDELRRGTEAAGAAAVNTCVLLRKRRDDVPDRPAVDFVGFDIDDHFVVGYGLDYDERYRNLPDLCLLAGVGEGRPT